MDYIVLSTMYLSYVISVFFFFKQKNIENKIIWLTIPHLIFWIILISSSFIYKSIYPSQNIGNIGVGITIFGGFPLFAITFAMGLVGLINQLKKFKVRYALMYLLAVITPVIPVSIFIFPFISIILFIRIYIRKKKKAKV